jgi:hypothetical protein
MELVLGQQELLEPGGTETYLLTVSEQLQRLGHEVTIFTVRAGTMGREAEARGLRVVTGESELPPDCDGVIAQDGVVSLTLAARYETTPQLFVAHAPGADVGRPVQLDGVISAVVVLNDKVARRLDALAHRHEIVRLRQPIDTRRFTPRGGPRANPERALMLSNYIRGYALEILEAACAEAGMELEHVGRQGRPTTTPEVDIAASDVTVGHGRAALEGMAAGRAVYVLDESGGGGWMTPESYAQLEASGFTSGSDGAIDGRRLRRDLAAYRAEMGPVNRQLACSHHHAMGHAAELVALLRRTPPAVPHANGPLREMARLVRVQWQTESYGAGLAVENERLRGELDRERERARRANEELDAVRRTRRYRLAAMLGRPFDALRRRR